MAKTFGMIQKNVLRRVWNHLPKLKIMTDNVLVGDNGVGEREDSHLSLTLPTPDLNLGKGMMEVTSQDGLK